jgi:transposase
MQGLYTEEAVSLYSVYNGVASSSPDLNPIELLWEQLDHMVHKKCQSSQSNLWEVLQEAWDKISSDYLNKFTTRIPKVCKAVIAENGGFFDESKVSIKNHNL